MISTENGDFVWYELLTTEPFASAEFYQQVLGWVSQRLDGVHGHVMCSSSEGPIASATTLPELAKQMGAPPYWTANLQVARVDDTCTRAKQLGGRVYHEPMDVAGIGRIAIIADPFGAVLNVFAPAKPMKAHDRALPAGHAESWETSRPSHAGMSSTMRIPHTDHATLARSSAHGEIRGSRHPLKR
jgi:uncharacterized protein